MANRPFSDSLIVPLTDSYSVEDFDCGEPARNAWLCTRAFGNHSTDDTRTYLAVKGSTVHGFYALTISSIIRGSLPGSVRRNAPDPVSCILLAQLAVSISCQRQGLGRQLVLHAMRQATKISEIGGGRLFAVHPARPDLEDYYHKFGLKSVDTAPPLMVMLMQKVRETLSAVKIAQG